MPTIIFKIEQLRSNDQKVVLTHEAHRIEKKWTEIGVADQILALRPGAKVRAQVSQDQNGDRRYSGFELAGFADDVVPGLGAEPDIDRNPYGFAAWMADSPFEADDREPIVLHQREGDPTCLHNGKLVVTFEAVTPVFVPGGGVQVDLDPHAPFFQCHDRSGERRFALPGSTVKGSIRVLFEALTNSRAGVSDRSTLDLPHLFRRRACELYIVNKLPTATADGEAEACRFCFADSQGCRVTPPRLPGEVNLTDPKAKGVTLVDWRANLFAVPSQAYRHRAKTKLAYQRTGRTVKLSQADIETWKSMASHPHFATWHKSNVENNPLAKSLYAGKPPDFNSYKANLFEIKVGSLLFGMTTGGLLRPFGKNVNFLWPSPSPADGARSFLSREEKDSRIDGSDAAELTFGYIAKRDQSSCLRGRVRFGTFWLDDETPKMSKTPTPVVLLPLTAPANAKAKSRTLYWQPKSATGSPQPPFPGAEGAAIRGRKIYWHQKPHPHAAVAGLPKQHSYDIRHGNGPNVPENNPPLRIAPLPAGARFTGEIHFSNLTPVELGALVASIHPGLVFGNDDATRAQHGIKIGKGKPRGLGSVRVTKLDLLRLQPIDERYAALGSDSDTVWQADEASVGDAVTRFQEWVEGSCKRAEIPDASFDQIAAIKDLRALTKIPDQPRVHVYPTRFNQYAWPAGWCNADGGPSDQNPANRKDRKPPAPMRRASELT